MAMSKENLNYLLQTYGGKENIVVLYIADTRKYIPKENEMDDFIFDDARGLVFFTEWLHSDKVTSVYEYGSITGIIFKAQ